MDSGTKIKKEINPRQNASLLSIFSFFFTFKTIRKGVRKDLKESDIYEVLNDYRSEKLGNRLDTLWKQELIKPKVSLMRPLIKMFGVQYATIWFPIFTIETSELVLKPILTGKVVSYFDPNTNMTLEEALWYSAGLLFIHFAFAVCDPTYFLMMELICMKIRIACCSLLYKKCLKLNLNTSHQFASGRIVTLITKDMFQFESALQYIQNNFSGLIHIVIASGLMYYEMGVASLVGIALLVVILPIQVYLGKKAADLRLKTLENTDQRVRLTQEILTAIRIIKMYTWEAFFSKSVNKLRKNEIKNLRLLFYLKAFSLSLGQISSSLAFYACVVTYVALGNHITAEKAFVVIGCFEALSRVLATYMPVGISFIAELRTSLKRIIDFLLLEELSAHENNILESFDKPQVTIEGVTVTTEQNILVLEDLNVEIKTGLTVVTGHIGAGKSTFIKLILGDIKKNKGIVKTSGKISYASQEPWLFPGTVKQNIIFGETFDAQRYDKIVQVCALKKDFNDFPNGDASYVTDKGLNMSRGQKTRINLARAIYRQADIYLLDDCLSAVDTHVAKHIFFECFKGYLKNKICVLVSHQKQFLKQVDEILILTRGKMQFQGTYANLETQSEELQFSLDQNKQSAYISELDEKPVIGNGKVEEIESVYAEVQEIGSVKKDVYYKLFIVNGGMWLILIVLGISIVTQFTTSWSDYFVSFWVDTEQAMSGFRMNHTTSSQEYIQLEKSHDFMMKQYSFVILIAVAFTFFRAFSYFFFFSNISKNIHKSILDKIARAQMLFFDKNLSGNVLNRFSRDLGIIDEKMPYVVFDVVRLSFKLIAILFIVTSVNWFFIVPSIVFVLILLIARKIYIPTGRSIRRLEGATRSPVIGHLNATLEGLTTIRASQAQDILNTEFDNHQNHFNSVTHMHLVTTKAFAFYLNITSLIYISIITLTFLLIKTESLAGEVGLAMTQSFTVSYIMSSFINNWAELENQMTSAERVLEYTNISTEKSAKKRPENWPANGKIVYKDINLRYLPTSENVLKDVSFVIEPKSKIGVVGRTGAGKSSIISVLFKLYDFQGTLTIDEVDINNVELHLLRSKISTIPQDPVLFSGTVRSNLDPNQEYEDTEIWAALDEVEIKSLVETLEAPITEGGSNYSIGQRQLLCLARAIIRKNTILVLDEATANVDPQTDELIQNTIKKNFSNCTVITIAHRLNTIMDSDKVIVMDSGAAVEYDSPDVLLTNTSSLFYNMVEEAGLLQTLVNS